MDTATLAREWMASEHWGGWRVGMMCALTGQVVVQVDDMANLWSDNVPRFAPPGTSPTPDLDHPGTRAFLLEDVRKAHRRKDVEITYTPFGWQFVFPTPNKEWEVVHPSEQAALIAALIAAPGIDKATP